MAINTIETAIINKIKTVITNLTVEGFPDKPSEYRLVDALGAVLVAFGSSVFERPNTTAFIQQNVDMEFTATLVIRNLRDKNGAYNYIDTIISALTGYAPTGCAKMYPIQVSFLGESGGIWQYGITFIVPTENFST